MPQHIEAAIALEGTSTRTEYPRANRADDFEQAGLLYRVLTADARERLIQNIARHMKNVPEEIQRRQIQHFFNADSEYGTRVARALNLKAGLGTH
jgi:catalase